MKDLSAQIKDLKENLLLLAEENISDFSDAEIVEYATDMLLDFAVENSVYDIAVRNNITGNDFDRWSEMAMKKLDEQGDDSTIEESDLLALLKDVRS